ncbi:hypothetical protein D3C87_2098830 [compost metagenome]
MAASQAGGDIALPNNLELGCGACRAFGQALGGMTGSVLVVAAGKAGWQAETAAMPSYARTVPG